MKTLSGHCHWFYAVVQGWKPIENRTWNTRYRGPILLHAARTLKRELFNEERSLIEKLANVEDSMPKLDQLPRGGIIGRADVVDVIPPFDFSRVGRRPIDAEEARDWTFEHITTGLTSRDIQWWNPTQFGWVLANVEPLPFMPCKGALGLFDVESREPKP